jgi:hypothetical protein
VARQGKSVCVLFNGNAFFGHRGELGILRQRPQVYVHTFWYGQTTSVEQQAD